MQLDVQWLRPKGLLILAACMLVATFGHSAGIYMALLIMPIAVAFPAYQGLPAQTRIWIISTTGATLFAHLLFWLFRTPYDLSQITTWKDDRVYWDQATALADAWKSGLRPNINHNGIEDYYMGTLHTGYQRILSAVYYFFSANEALGRLLNLVLATTFPLQLTAMALYLTNTHIPSADSALQERLVKATCLLAMFHPAQYYWTSFLLKDVLHAYFALGGMVALLATLRLQHGIHAIIWGTIIWFLYQIRIYSALSLVLAPIFLVILRFRTGTLLRWVALAIVFFYAMINYTESGTRQWAQISDSLAAIIPAQAGLSTGAMLLHTVKGIQRFLLGPYGWVAPPETDPLHYLYPNSWFLYLAIYPLVICGFVLGARRHWHLFALPITVFVLGMMVFLIADFGGNVVRQRYYLEILLIPFAAIGWIAPQRKPILIYAGILAAFITGHLISLHIRGML